MATPALNSVAVLYFDNLSPDTADAFLADGISEQVMSHLGQINRLAVKRASRAAVRRIRDSLPDYVVALGRILAVRYVVEGSVRRAGPRLRVAARLVRAADGVEVWREDYERGPSELISLEDEIARGVARGVAGRLSPTEVAAIALAPSRNPEAHEHYLRGNFYVSQRTAPALGRAIDEYEAAARIDTAFVDALGLVGYVYALCHGMVLPCRDLPPDSLLARGLAVTDRALDRDSGAADAWLARAVLLQNTDPHNYGGVEQAIERALALGPNNAEVWHWYGNILNRLGRDSAAAAAYRHALEIEPFRSTELNGLGYTAFFAHRFDEAARWLDSTIALDPALPNPYFIRARLRLLQGDTTGARTDAEMWQRLTGRRFLADAIRAVIAASRGDTADARRGLDQVRREGGTPGAQAGILVALHEDADALAMLERLQPGIELFLILRSPEFDPIRSDARFQRLVDESRPR